MGYLDSHFDLTLCIVLFLVTIHLSETEVANSFT